MCILACVAGVLHMQLQEEAWDGAFSADNAAQLAEQCVATGNRAKVHVRERQEHRRKQEERSKKRAASADDKDAKQARTKRAKLVAGQFTRDELSAAVAGDEVVWRAVRPTAARSDAGPSNAGEEQATASATAARYGSPAKKKRQKGRTAIEVDVARFQDLVQGPTQVRQRQLQPHSSSHLGAGLEAAHLPHTDLPRHAIAANGQAHDIPNVCLLAGTRASHTRSTSANHCRHTANAGTTREQ